MLTTLPLTCVLCTSMCYSHKKLHFFWYRWRSHHEYLVQGQFLIVVIATIGIMEKYTGQTFIIDTYEKNDNNSMRLDPLCNFCLHFQISGAGVNIIFVARDRLFITTYQIYLNLSKILLQLKVIPDGFLHYLSVGYIIFGLYLFHVLCTYLLI